MPKIADTKTFLKLAKLADTQQLNRRVNTEELTHELDPIGTHIVYLHAMVSDFTIRCSWMLKVRNSIQPREVDLDVPIGYYNALEDWVEPGD